MTRVRAAYRKLLALYPRPFRERFGESMEQTFNDLYRERKEAGNGLFGFILRTFAETSGRIIRENLEHSPMKNITMSPASAALFGLLFIVPFAILNAIVANQWQPFYFWIAERRLNNLGGFGAGFWMVTFILLLMPAGASVALRPVLRKDASGRRKWYIANVVVAVLLLAVFIIISAAIGEEIYRCDILRIPNCD